MYRHALVARAAVVALATSLTLAGCSWRQLSMSPHIGSASSTHSAPARPAASGSATPTARPVAASSSHPGAGTTAAPLVRGDLASGSVTHKLGADGPTLVVNYWTTQNVGTWTTRVSAPIQLSAHLEDVHNRDQARVSRFRASLTTDASANATVLVDDAGSFVITPPYSYGSAFVLPAQPTQAHNATVTVEFDLLIETAPSSHQYYRQTVLDTLNFTFVPANQELLND